MTRVHVCNYGIGNIHNILRALRHVGAEVVDCTSPDQLTDVERLVIPGVGAFSACIDAFTQMGFREPVMEVIESGTDVLGICVGMQMLADISEEFGEFKGLGVITGRVRRLPEAAADGTPLAVPHISWSKLLDPGARWEGTPLQAISSGAYAYFIHSYFFDCAQNENQLATFSYGERMFTAAVRKGRVFGTQFHPEKSAEPGLRVLQAFVSGESRRHV